MHSVRSFLRHASGASAGTLTKKQGLILGCGSNVVDVFFRVRQLPKPGEKGYFSDESISCGTVVGGVTLNHLSWARALGAPTGLLALQGDDANGRTIRSKLDELGVATEHIRVSSEYSTSVSHILIEPSGERTIIMAPASTSRMTGELMAREWASVVAGASMVTTEVSQLPLSGVQFLLNAARAAGIPSAIDVDVTPSIATGAARLGTLDELRAALSTATVVKGTASAAEELLFLFDKQAKGGSSGPGVSSLPPARSIEDMAQRLGAAVGAQLCVLTDGSHGAGFAALPSSGRPETLYIPAYGGAKQVDATGAGDAFFGGLVAGIAAQGIPREAAQLDWLGRMAACAGAACVEVLGALPVLGVRCVVMQAALTRCCCMRAVNTSCSSLHPHLLHLALLYIPPFTTRAVLSLPPCSEFRMAEFNPASKELIAAAAAAAAARLKGASTAAATSANPLKVRAADAAATSEMTELETQAMSAAYASIQADGMTMRALAGAARSHKESQSMLNSSFLRLARACVACSNTTSNAASKTSSSSSSSCKSTSSGGHVYATGIGKSGVVAQRLAVSLRSIGVRASFVHAAEWAHGDLGGIAVGDTVIALSHSGRTPELMHALPLVQRAGAAVFAMTNSNESPVAKLASSVPSSSAAAAAVAGAGATEAGSALASSPSGGSIPVDSGADLLGVIPTRSIVAQEAAANALLTAVAFLRGLTLEEFRRSHPGGAIGAAAQLK